MAVVVAVSSERPERLAVFVFPVVASPADGEDVGLRPWALSVLESPELVAVEGAGAGVEEGVLRVELP